jgi:hypothetical protein
MESIELATVVAANAKSHSLVRKFYTRLSLVSSLLNSDGRPLVENAVVVANRAGSRA